METDTDTQPAELGNPAEEREGLSRPDGSRTSQEILQCPLTSWELTESELTAREPARN